jgi:hypothetical protein
MYWNPNPWPWIGSHPDPSPWLGWGWRSQPDPSPWIARGGAPSISAPAIKHPVWDKEPWSEKGPTSDPYTWPHTERKWPTADGSSLPWILE